eukprot:TRINITY_DN9049_c0_g1_i2.p1 TRINITY_DN9049_c0_g1~~TRINITY_DN9049_c0_g1_i2.p1  ORF type:complete len:518 (+),score=116.01 TRINITY_DN9049_c0_g1_i2:1459-3012(+)
MTAVCRLTTVRGARCACVGSAAQRFRDGSARGARGAPAGGAGAPGPCPAAAGHPLGGRGVPTHVMLQPPGGRAPGAAQLGGSGQPAPGAGPCPAAGGHSPRHGWGNSVAAAGAQPHVAIHPAPSSRSGLAAGWDISPAPAAPQPPGAAASGHSPRHGWGHVPAAAALQPPAPGAAPYMQHYPGGYQRPPPGQGPAVAGGGAHLPLYAPMPGHHLGPVPAPAAGRPLGYLPGEGNAPRVWGGPPDGPPPPQQQQEAAAAGAPVPQKGSPQSLSSRGLNTKAKSWSLRDAWGEQQCPSPLTQSQDTGAGSTADARPSPSTVPTSPPRHLPDLLSPSSQPGPAAPFPCSPLFPDPRSYWRAPAADTQGVPLPDAWSAGGDWAAADDDDIGSPVELCTCWERWENGKYDAEAAGADAAILEAMFRPVLALEETHLAAARAREAQAAETCSALQRMRDVEALLEEREKQLKLEFKLLETWEYIKTVHRKMESGVALGEEDQWAARLIIQTQQLKELEAAQHS